LLELLATTHQQLDCALRAAERWRTRTEARQTDAARSRVQQEVGLLILKLERLQSSASSPPEQLLDRPLTSSEHKVIAYVRDAGSRPQTATQSRPSSSVAFRVVPSHLRPSSASLSTLPPRPGTGSGSSRCGSRPSTAASDRASRTSDSYAKADLWLSNNNELTLDRVEQQAPLLRSALTVERRLLTADIDWLQSALDSGVEQLTTEGTCASLADESNTIPTLVELQATATTMRARLADLEHEQKMAVMLDARRSVNQPLAALQNTSNTLHRTQSSVDRSQHRPIQPLTSPKPPSAPAASSRPSAGTIRSRQYRIASVDGKGVAALGLMADGDKQHQHNKSPTKRGTHTLS
jgi:hypothetical protein